MYRLDCSLPWKALQLAYLCNPPFVRVASFQRFLERPFRNLLCSSFAFLGELGCEERRYVEIYGETPAGRGAMMMTLLHDDGVALMSRG